SSPPLPASMFRDRAFSCPRVNASIVTREAEIQIIREDTPTRVENFAIASNARGRRRDEGHPNAGSRYESFRHIDVHSPADFSRVIPLPSLRITPETPHEHRWCNNCNENEQVKQAGH